MNIQQIRNAVDAGQVVYWSNSGYRVTKDNLNQYNIVHHGGNVIGLTNLAGDKLNGKESEFYVKETAKQQRDNRSAFYNAYFECARWSSDIDPEKDFDARLCAVLTHNAELFYKENDQEIHCDGAPLGEYWDGATEAMRRASMAGHDFWLTQNGHGAGFWDGDWPEPQAAQLTAASEQFAAIEIYTGDDGKIYGA